MMALPKMTKQRYAMAMADASAKPVSGQPCSMHRIEMEMGTETPAHGWHAPRRPSVGSGTYAGVHIRAANCQDRKDTRTSASKRKKTPPAHPLNGQPTWPRDRGGRRSGGSAALH